MQATASARPRGDTPIRRDGPFAWYVTAVLLAAYTYSFIDRQVMNLLVEPIRASFRLDDVEVSLLLGFAFIVAYAIAAPFGGRFADRGNRRMIVAVAIFLWSMFTIGCGLAPSYGWLFAARFAAGASEALLLPAAWSLIADYFSRERLPRAMGLFLLGPYVGGGLALILGGAIVHGAFEGSAIEGWRQAFIVAGAIGAVPAILALTMREPPRGGPRVSGTDAPTTRQIASYFRKHGGFYSGFYGGISLQTITFFAFPAWMPTFVVRHFDVSLGEIGFHYGLISLVLGCAGVLAGPALARALERRGRADANMRIAAWSSTAIAPVALMIPFVPDYGSALVIMGLVTFIGSLPMPTNAAALQLVTPNRMRGVAASIYMFVVSLVGVAVPPTLIALLTDHVFHDTAMVGYSLGIVCFVASIFALIVLWVMLPAYSRALRTAHKLSQEA